MPMQHLAISLPFASTLTEQSVSSTFHVEVMNDLETGQPMLLSSSDPNLGDLQVVTAEQVIAKAAEQREQLDRIEALANEYATNVAIPQFVEQYNIDLIESDLDGLADVSPEIAAGFTAWAALMKDGHFLVVVPKGQPPVLRLAALRDLVLDLHGREAK